MRWSPYVSLFAVLAITSIFEGVFAAPLDVVLESRARVRPAQSAKSKKLTAGSLKKSSSTYRKNALKSSTFTKASGGKMSKTRTPKAPPRGKDADHILEAQTVAKAMQKGGYTTTGSLGAAYQPVKDTLNHQDNLAFVDADVNRDKGKAHKAALSGKNPSASSHVKDYMKQTKTAGINTAKKIDGVLKKYGVPNVSVEKEQHGVLNKIGIKRELSLEELD